MPRSAPPLEAPYRRGEKVLATRDLPGVPEGTRGKVKLINGLNTWVRYWVRFEDGTMLGQVDHDNLVRLGQLSAWHDREDARAESAQLAADGAADGAAEVEAGAGDADAAGGAASLIPAAILERSKAAKARLLGG